MITGFEDAFTDVQSEFISLCLEFVDNDADEIYVYIYRTETEKTFNAFFKKDNRVLSAGEIGTDEQSDEFLMTGMRDIRKLVEVCDKYEHKCPNEFKLTYNTATKHFDAEYRYKEYTTKDKVTAVNVFINWLNNERNKSSN